MLTVSGNHKFHFSRKMDLEHLSCMVHTRAKFKYAQEQGSDSRADKFIDLIGRLYAFEEDYKRDKLSLGKIKEK